MKILISFVISFFIINFSQSQNILHNSDFEQIDASEISGAINNIPNAPAQFMYLLNWEDDLDIDTETDEWGNEITHYLHSPDWYKYGSDFCMKEFIPPNNYIFVPANSGLSYIGMASSELITQRIFDNDQFNSRYKYKLKLKIRTVKNIALGGSYFDHNLKWTGAKLCIHFSKYNISYKNDDINDACTSDFGIHNNGLFQSILEDYITFDIDLNNYPPGNWYELETEFSPPPSAYNPICLISS